MQRDMSYGLAVVLCVCEAHELDGLEAFLAPCRCVLDVVHHPHRPFVLAMAAGVEQLCSGRKRKLQ